MENFRKILVNQETTIRETIRIIDQSAMQIALAVDEQNKLLGTITDGDIRRGILQGISLEGPVKSIMNRKPNVCRLDDDREAILSRMKLGRLHHLPVLDGAGCVVGLEMLDELLAPVERENVVVLMAGGLGTRLRPLTEECPKPMLKIGGRPILETILLSFMEFGFRKFYICVNYKAEIITEYFGDGSRWGAEIRYVHETRKLGTAGALSLLPERPAHPIFVMNGDLLTKVNFNHLLDFHVGHHVNATMCVREYDFQVPYGVVKIDTHKVVGIEEKPVHRFFVNAGVYVLEPKALDLIPQDTYFDMTTLFEKLVDQDQGAAVFPVREYWLDVGHMADFERANGEFQETFHD